MPNPESLSSASRARTITTFTGGVNLVSDATNGGGAPCRRIRVQSKGSGALVLRLAGDSADTVFSNLADGEILDVQAVSITESGTSVAAINVFW